jgi:predicted GIY-YIG superfamily endonuclease
MRAGAQNATDFDVRGVGARFVYILKSDSHPDRHYVGRTANVDERLAWHNAGPCGYTRHYRPWTVIVSLEFPNESCAARFERYLKSGSGRAFAKWHFGSVLSAPGAQ